MNKDTQSWSNSNLTEMEELVQKVQQLETENAALRKENRKAHDMACEDAVERYRLNGENAALHVELQEQCALNGTGSEREYVLRGRVDRLKRENAVLRSLLREAIREHVDPYDLPEGDAYIARVEAALGEAKP